jgi:hypothetical protein
LSSGCDINDIVHRSGHGGNHDQSSVCVEEKFSTLTKTVHDLSMRLDMKLPFLRMAEILFSFRLWLVVLSPMT